MAHSTVQRRIRSRVRLAAAARPPQTDCAPAPDRAPPPDLALEVAITALDVLPEMTVDRVEVFADGRYAAHLHSRGGERVVVDLDRHLMVQGWLASPV